MLSDAESQEELERLAVVERDLVEAKVEEVYSLIKQGLGSIGGLDVAAGVCGMNAGDLQRSLRKDGRRLAVDHVMAIAARVRRYNATLATRIGFALVRPLELGVFPRVTMPDKERADRCEAKLRTIGQQLGIGDQLIDDALGGNR